jgi:hypothetical protein
MFKKINVTNRNQKVVHTRLIIVRNDPFRRCLPIHELIIVESTTEQREKVGGKCNKRYSVVYKQLYVDNSPIAIFII